MDERDQLEPEREEAAATADLEVEGELGDQVAGGDGPTETITFGYGHQK